MQGSDTAVYVGVMSADFTDMVGRDTDTFPTYFATGTARSILSNRLSYFFDWHGPSMTIDTACSSSLIAMHQAVQTIRGGDSSMAVVSAPFRPLISEMTPATVVELLITLYRWLDPI
ncbi:thiolase-like protein [Xylaria sp. FL0043]|nr:thiolase-like protein [Xylaria sp. FL0043]